MGADLVALGDGLDVNLFASRSGFPIIVDIPLQLGLHIQFLGHMGKLLWLPSDIGGFNLAMYSDDLVVFSRGNFEASHHGPIAVQQNRNRCLGGRHVEGVKENHTLQVASLAAVIACASASSASLDMPVREALRGVRTSCSRISVGSSFSGSIQDCMAI